MKLVDENTFVTILMTTVLRNTKDEGKYKPLSTVEWNNLARWLYTKGYEPANLLDNTRATVFSHLADELEAGRIRGVSLVRYAYLIARSDTLENDLDRWVHQLHIWPSTRKDKFYPQNLLEKLGDLAPPVIFETGSSNQSCGQGTAIVGSRNADIEALDFARATGRLVGQSFSQVVSGCARGVDEASMMASLEDGCALGVVPCNLAGAVRNPKWKRHIDRGTLALVSPYGPDTQFSRDRAMGRNKVIYGLSQQAVVVACDQGRGGTWNGAIQNEWVPMYVRNTDKGGNLALAKAAAAMLIDNPEDIAPMLPDNAINE